LFHETQFQAGTLIALSMSRKKWTPQEEVTEALTQSREKRKWQIALRRYVLEQNKSAFYAPYFGLDIQKFRNWIEVQFDETCTWENFSTAWQFDHIVPISYFDFTSGEDLSLCWNFTNIRIEKTSAKNKRQVDVLTAKTYFQTLFKNTGYQICERMVLKISGIEAAQIASNQFVEQFIQENKTYLELVSGFGSYEFEKLNTGIDLNTIIYEKDFLKKFGN
jgi:hypothetical protein